MRLGLVRMGAHFGELAKVRGIVYHYLSPFEQRAFAGAIKRGVPNTIRRTMEHFWRIVPGFVVSYLIFASVEEQAEQMKRKNPDDYACDE